MSLQRMTCTGGGTNRYPLVSLLCIALAVGTLLVYLGHRVHVHLQHGASPVTLARTSASGITKPKQPATPLPAHTLAFMPMPEQSAPQTLKPTQPAQVIETSPAKAPPKPAADVQWEVTDEQPTFNGRPIRPVRNMRMLVTAYSPDRRSCGQWADGYTASGYSVFTNGMNLVAADTRLLPFGTLVSVPGYNNGKPVPVLDRGGAIKGHRLDLLYPTHQRARQWGSQRLDVVVWEYAD